MYALASGRNDAAEGTIPCRSHPTPVMSGKFGLMRAGRNIWRESIAVEGTATESYVLETAWKLECKCHPDREME